MYTQQYIKAFPDDAMWTWVLMKSVSTFKNLWRKSSRKKIHEQRGLVATFPNLFACFVQMQAENVCTSSALKRVKNYFRNSTIDQRLIQMAYFAIDLELLNTIRFD